MLVDSNAFQSATVHIPTKYDNVELIAVDLLCGNFTCRFVTVYRPPSSDTDTDGAQYCLQLAECIDFLGRQNVTMVICGDFNIPNLNTSGHNPLSCSSIICDMFQRHGLTQFVSSPTRYNYTTNTASILDLVLCNDENFIFDTTVNAPFDNSDHCIICFNILNSSIDNNRIPRGSYDFKRADWAAIFTFLNTVDFSNEFANCVSSEQCFDCFYRIINSCIDANVPYILNRNCNFINRYPAAIRRNFTRKRAAWRKYRETRSAAALQRYKHLASVCRSSVYEYTVKREQKIVDSGNVSSFYRHCNRKFTNKSVIGPLRSPEGNMVLDPREKAELFQRVFSSYYSHDNGKLPHLTPYTSNCISNIIFTPGLVSKAIKHLKTNSKGGPDRIPPEFIKKCCLWLTTPLSFLFQCSFSESYIPPIWLTASVCPIFKKGDRSDPNNYRPISLTCVVCKLMEHIIKCQLMSYLLEHKLISKKQHAFLIHHSTISNLLESTRDWTIALSSKHYVDTIFIDYQRAFDSIVHSKLLAKLRCFGINDKLLSWLSAFLSNRSQQVVIENFMSNSIPVVSGIIQGSVLGPILFILFINDISSIINSPVDLQLFADDLKLYTNFTISHDSSSQPNPLQLTLDSVYSYSVDWQLTINISKCSCTRFSSNSASSSQPAYNINGLPLSTSNITRDLGVLTDSRLSYSKHIDQITAKANQRVAVLFRGFQCRRPDFLCKAYITYVRPLLEYASVVWNPSLKKHIDQIERVQRQFSKRIPALADLPFLRRLERLNLESLERRRLNFDLCYYYKILNNLTPHNPVDFFAFHHPPASLRNNTPLLKKPTNCNNSILSSFRFRAINSWNNLPDHLKQCNSLPLFKKRLKLLNLDSFLYGSCYTNNILNTTLLS